MSFKMSCEEHNLVFSDFKDFLLHMSVEHNEVFNTLSDVNDKNDESFFNNLTLVFSEELKKKLEHVGKIEFTGHIYSSLDFFIYASCSLITSNGSPFSVDFEFMSENFRNRSTYYEDDCFIVADLDGVVKKINTIYKNLLEYESIATNRGATDFKVTDYSFEHGYINVSFNYKNKSYNEAFRADLKHFSKFFDLLDGSSATFVADLYDDGCVNDILFGIVNCQHLYRLARAEGKKLKATFEFIDEK